MPGVRWGLRGGVNRFLKYKGRRTARIYLVFTEKQHPIFMSIYTSSLKGAFQMTGSKARSDENVGRCWCTAEESYLMMMELLITSSLQSQSFDGSFRNSWLSKLTLLMTQKLKPTNVVRHEVIDNQILNFHPILTHGKYEASRHKRPDMKDYLKVPIVSA